MEGNHDLPVLNMSEDVRVGGGTSREDFIRVRTERDAGLSMPKSIPSRQMNMRAGNIPRGDSGAPMRKVPINGL